MKIVKVTQNDFTAWLDLALKLWPDETVEEMQASLTAIFASPREVGFLVKDDTGRAIAFMNLSLRYEYVPGAIHSPVAYIEGIYVDEEYRQQGVGKQLVQFALQWGLSQGCVELASDALIENRDSYLFHTKLGFQEVERVVFFIQSIPK